MMHNLTTRRELLGAALFTVGLPSVAHAQPAGMVATPALRPLVPPKRSADEAIGAFSQPAISGPWLAATSGFEGTEQGDVVHLFRKLRAGWSAHSFLSPPAGAEKDIGFGYVLAIDGNTLAVGAPLQSVNGLACGAVHIFQFDGNQWLPTARVDMPDAVDQANFGNHLALQGDTLVVGEMQGGFEAGGQTPSRGLYMFKRTGTTWKQSALLSPPQDSRAMRFRYGSERFGNYFALDKRTLAVTEMGNNSVHVFELLGNVWHAQSTLQAPRDGSDGPGGPGYGRNAAVAGDLLVVGAFEAAGATAKSGAAFVYRRAQGGWIQEAKLVAPDGAAGDMFGHWVAQDAGTVLVGAFRQTVDGHKGCGAAYAFKKENGAWAMVRKLVPPQPERQQFTAYELAASGGTVVMTAGNAGAPQKSDRLWVVDLG